MSQKLFELAADEFENVNENDDKVLEIKLPVYKIDEETKEPEQTGTRIYESYLPTETQIALYAGSLGSGTTTGQMAGVLRFVQACFLPESLDEILERMQDRRDPVGLKVLQSIIAWVIEETTANPSTESATSTRSPRQTGSASKASSRPKAQTRSRGPRDDS